jgi:hypothetical protein
METPRGLRAVVSRLDALLPGIRLRQRLGALGAALSHQTIVDLLGQSGAPTDFLTWRAVECRFAGGWF